MNSFKIKINDELKGLTVKDFFQKTHLGKDKINFYQNELFVNNEKVTLNKVLDLNDLLEVKINEKIDLKPIEYNLNVIYEDDYYIIINKPKNILVHSDGSCDFTLSHILAGYYQKHHIRRKIRVCNRLDFSTSGLVIFAKDDISKACMDYLISSRLIDKKYYALCYNRFSKSTGEINLPIARDRHNDKKMRISKTGKEALTTYKVLKNGKYSLVDVTLLTGRTHQIRVHLSYINHPLVGDELYGNDEEQFLMLQSYYLRFIHPFTNKEVLIKIEMESILIDYMEDKYGK